MSEANQAHLLAIGMRNPISRRRMFELAASYDARAEPEAGRTCIDGQPVARCLPQRLAIRDTGVGVCGKMR